VIFVLATARHIHTHSPVVAAIPRDVSLLSYEKALRARSLPHATYIFADLDRLGYWELELAADLYRLLTAAGCKVLNDPARVVQRAGLLIRLHAAGVNDFRAWRAEDGVLPDRFPVFLRTTAAHRGVISGLLPDLDAALNALDEAIADGYPMRDLLFVEYCAQANADGTFWKHAVFRIGDEMLPGPSVLDTNWVSKNGIAGLATDEDMAFERDIVRDAKLAEALRPIFDEAGIAYGRADFAVVDGRITVYEINTNPNISLSASHRSPIRAETLSIVRDRYLAALLQLRPAAQNRRAIPVRSSRFDRSFGYLRRRLRTP
jgi:hypothetical protein